MLPLLRTGDTVEERQAMIRFCAKRITLFGTSVCLPVLLAAACSDGAAERAAFDCIDFDGDGSWVGLECHAMSVEWSVDCDDLRADVYPGAPELCDGVDNACSGRVDRSPVGTGDPCESGLPPPCGSGLQECREGAWQCRVSGAPGEEPEGCNGIDEDCDGLTDEDTPETCDGADNDCDGLTDEDFECAPVGREDGCTTDCGLAGRHRCTETCAWSACAVPLEIVGNDCDDDGDGTTDECDVGPPGGECSAVFDCGCYDSWDTCRLLYYGNSDECYVRQQCEYDAEGEGTTGSSCASTYDCLPGLICLDGDVCTPLCRNDYDCPGGWHCFGTLLYGGEGACATFELEGVGFCVR